MGQGLQPPMNLTKSHKINITSPRDPNSGTDREDSTFFLSCQYDHLLVPHGFYIKQFTPLDNIPKCPGKEADVLLYSAVSQLCGINHWTSPKGFGSDPDPLAGSPLSSSSSPVSSCGTSDPPALQQQPRGANPPKLRPRAAP